MDEEKRRGIYVRKGEYKDGREEERSIEKECGEDREQWET